MPMPPRQLPQFVSPHQNTRPKSELLQKNPFTAKILTLLHHVSSASNTTGSIHNDQFSLLVQQNQAQGLESNTLASVHNFIRKSKRQVETTPMEDFRQLAQESIRLGFESLARLFIEYGKLDVSVLYNSELWREGKERLKHRGHDEHAEYRERISGMPGTRIKKYDRYGFLMHKKTECVLQWNDLMDRKQTARMKKWKSMLHWKNPLDRGLMGLYRRNKWKKRVRKGIPYNVRKEAWHKMMPVKSLKNNHKGAYQRCLEQEADPNHTKVIDCDILRQSRNHRFFQEKFSTHMISLFNILRAYSVYDSEVGYCQGMCPLAMCLYIVLEDEEDAFWAFWHIMNSPEHMMRELFRAKFSMLKESYWIHDQMLQELPPLKRHFQSMGVTSEYYATKNYMTIFVDLLEFDVAVLIMDSFLLDGRRVTFSFSKAILQNLSPELLKRPFEEVLPMLQHLDEVEMDISQIMHHKRFSKSRLRDLRAMYSKHLKGTRNKTT
mmetsp:Transcript_5068/g.18984  ORF Transcript_5068/g.18984 Transcript_5068/m.18984 type:complete len:492 (-) Transcript_5068:438-1913(-)